MLPKPLSAADCVSPAIEVVKFRFRTPGRWAKWWRIGLLGLIIGEYGGCSGGNVGDLARLGRETGEKQDLLQRSRPWANMPPETFAAIVATLVVGAIVLVLLHMYFASVLRFVWWDAATTGRYHIREGWRRWRTDGTQFFWFVLGFSIVTLVALGILVAPLIAGIVSGYFKGYGGRIALAVLIYLPTLFCFLLIAAVIFLMMKDFGVPMMALEGLRPLEALGRAWRMIKAAKGDYAGYVGMKIVLAIAFSIGTGIIGFIILMVLLVPLIITGVGAGIAWPELFKNPVTLALLITLLVVFVVVFSLALAILFAPAMFFFQVYANLFFGSRYLPLWNMMYPPPPPMPVAPATDTMPGIGRDLPRLE